MNYQMTDELINSLLKTASEAAKVGEEKKSEYFLLKSLETLYNMILKCGDDAIGRYEKDVPTVGIRVVKVNKLIPKEVLIAMNDMVDKEGTFERVFCSGLYITLPVVHIPKAFLENNCIKRSNKKCYVYHVSDIPEIEELGVRVVDSTIHINSDGSALVIQKCPLTDYITSGNQYKMVELY